jgi:hypothetical protein
VSRPDVTIVPGGPIVAGGPLLLDITIDAPDELDIQGITLAVRGKQGWEVGGGRSTTSWRAPGRFAG